jgi:hypothetical protein
LPRGPARVLRLLDLVLDLVLDGVWDGVALDEALLEQMQPVLRTEARR